MSYQYRNSDTYYTKQEVMSCLEEIWTLSWNELSDETHIFLKDCLELDRLYIDHEDDYDSILGQYLGHSHNDDIYEEEDSDIHTLYEIFKLSVPLSSEIKRSMRHIKYLMKLRETFHVYRTIEVPDRTSISIINKKIPNIVDTLHIGISWTPKLSAVYKFISNNIVRPASSIILKAEVTSRDVDWLASIMLNLYFHGEYETRLLRGRKILLEEIIYPESDRYHKSHRRERLKHAANTE